MKKKLFHVFLLALLLTGGCGKEEAMSGIDDENKVDPAGFFPVSIFKIDGDFSQYVPLGVDLDSRSVVCIPRSGYGEEGDSKPIQELHDGWYMSAAVNLYPICFSTVKWKDYNSGAKNHRDVENSIDWNACGRNWGMLPEEISRAFEFSKTPDCIEGDLSIINDYIDAGLPGFEMHE